MQYNIKYTYDIIQKGGDENHGLSGVGFGIRNVGVTCWLNAYTQLIIHSYEFMKKLKLVQELNNKDTADKQLLDDIIQFILSLHNNIKDNNKVGTLNGDVMRPYADNMARFIENGCLIGVFQDSDERLSQFIQKIVVILNMEYKPDFIASNILVGIDEDTIINTKKNELVQSKQNNNPFDIIFEITKNIYKDHCDTIIDSDGNTQNILGSVQINIINGWLTISGTAFQTNQNNNLQQLINDKLTGEVEDMTELICGGKANSGSIKVTFNDNTNRTFQASGNPDPAKVWTINIHNNIVYYTQTNKLFNSGEARPDKDPGGSPGSPDSIWVILQECDDHINAHNLQIVSADRTVEGEPYVDATKTKNYNLIKNGILPSSLFIKIGRPSRNFPALYGLPGKNTDYSVSIKLDEEIYINNIQEKPQKYILIGGTINEDLDETHYTSFVRRNNKYYFQDDASNPVEITSLDVPKYKQTTTFILYEKVNTIVDIIKNCNK